MLLTPQIRNIIFDLGGILLDLNYQLTFDAFARLGAPQLDVLFSRSNQVQLFDRYEKGLISSEVFRAELRELLGINPTDTELDQAWNAMLLTMPRQRLEILRHTATTHRVFLLSNTNEIHIRFIEQYMQQEHAVPDFKNLFEKAWYSYEAGLRKPHREIFDFALQDADLDPAETLFIDDSMPNVKGALEAGIQAVHLERGIIPADFDLGL